MELHNHWIRPLALLILTYFGISVSGSSPLSYEYYLLNPNIASGNLSVISLSETNKIKSGNTALTLEKYAIGQIPVADLAQGTLISGTGPFTLGSEVNATDLPAPGIFAGTKFVIPHYRDNHTYYLLSPYNDAVATVTIAGVATSVPLTKGVVVSFDAGANNDISGIVQSDKPVLVSHVAGVSLDTDAYPVPPASLQAWGVRSSFAYVGALENTTTVTVYSSDNFSETFVLNAGDKREVSVGDNSVQGLGAALHIVADKPVAVVQSADADGAEATTFLDTPYLGTRYGIPVDSQYIAVVCTKAGTTVTLKDGVNTSVVKTCSSDGDTPGKLYFGDASYTVNYSAGTYLESNHPIYITYDTGILGDEHNVTGHKDSYFVMDTNTGTGDMNVISLVNNNQINAGSTTLTLNEFELGVLPSVDLLQGTEITGTGPYTLGSAVDATDMPVPGVFAGTRFVIPHHRDTHYYFLLSPYADTTAIINIAGVETPVALLKGQVSVFNAGADNTISGIVQSENPILISHTDSGSISDAYPVPPVSLEAWGVKSTIATVGALENSTTVTVYSSDNYSDSFVLNAGDKQEISVGDASAQGLGAGLHIVADKPVAVVQSSDADGSETTAFFDTPYLGTRYAIPVDTDYIAVVCTATTTVRLQVDFKTVEEQSCISDGTMPGKVYFVNASTTVNYAAATYLESSQPIYVIYDTASQGDEHNLLGFNIARKVSPPASIVANTDFTRSSSTYSITGTAGAGEMVNVYINGVLDHSVPADATTGAYFAMPTLSEGMNYIYTTVTSIEGESLPSEIVTVNYIPDGKVEYYVVDPTSAANELTIYSQADDNRIFAGANQYTLNNGETVTLAAADIEQGDVIWGNAAFSVGSFSAGANLVPKNLLGTSFVMPHLDAVNQQYYVFSPENNATLTVNPGALVINVPKGQVEMVNVTGNTSISSTITSDVPVAISYHNSNVDYAYPVAPASLEVWGIYSSMVRLGVLEDETTITVEASDSNGTIETYVLNAGAKQTITAGENFNQGEGSSLHISADKPIAVVQVNDGDGNAATSFWPSSLHATYYTIPVNTGYVAIACNQPGTTVSLVDNSVIPAVTNSVTCDGSATKPGKAYFEHGTGGYNINAGATIQASAPIYLYHETRGGYEDEHNLLGFNIELFPPLQSGITRSNGPYRLDGTAGAGEMVNVYINGVLDHSVPADATTGAYFAMLTLKEGRNYVYTTVTSIEGESLPSEIVTVNYIPDGKVEYYVVDPISAANELTIYSLVDGNRIFAGANQYTLNNGETITLAAADIEQGDVIWGNAAFSVGSFSAGANLVPKDLLGTSFVMPHLDAVNQQYYVFSPENDATLTVNPGALVRNVPKGQVVMVDVTGNTSISSTITSDVPVAISYHNSNVDYAYPVAPASLEVWGIYSTYAIVGVLENSTRVTVEASDGTIKTYDLNAGDKQKVTAGVNSSQGLGTSLHISADKPIAAVQANDGDGNAATSFWPSSLHATYYTIPVNTGYVAIACNQPDTTVSLVDNSVIPAVTNSVTCDGSATRPGKAYFEHGTGGYNINAGASIQASSPIYLYHEIRGGYEDEHNLLGFNLDILTEGGTLFGNVGDMTLTAHTKYTVNADITVGTSQTLTIEQGAEIHFVNDAGLEIPATAGLIINGTALNPVVLTSKASTTNWDGIIINAGATNVVIDHAIIEYATIGLFFNNSSGIVSNSTLRNNWTAILTHEVNATPSITSSTITANDLGLSVTGTGVLGGNSNPVVTGNSIFNNLTMNYVTSSFYSPATSNLNATDNWWGTTEPSVIADKIYDHVDVPLDSPTVTYSPFLSAAP